MRFCGSFRYYGQDRNKNYLFILDSSMCNTHSRLENLIYDLSQKVKVDIHKPYYRDDYDQIVYKIKLKGEVLEDNSPLIKGQRYMVTYFTNSWGGTTRQGVSLYGCYMDLIIKG